MQTRHTKSNSADTISQSSSSSSLSWVDNIINITAILPRVVVKTRVETVGKTCYQPTDCSPLTDDFTVRKPVFEVPYWQREVMQWLLKNSITFPRSAQTQFLATVKYAQPPALPSDVYGNAIICNTTGKQLLFPIFPTCTAFVLCLCCTCWVVINKTISSADADKPTRCHVIYIIGSDDARPSYCVFSIFKMAAVRHLGFLYFCIFLWKIQICAYVFVVMQNLAKVGLSMAELVHIFDFQNGVCPPSWIC